MQAMPGVFRKQHCFRYIGGYDLPGAARVVLSSALQMAAAGSTAGKKKNKNCGKKYLCFFESCRY